MSSPTLKVDSLSNIVQVESEYYSQKKNDKPPRPSNNNTTNPFQHNLSTRVQHNHYTPSPIRHLTLSSNSRSSTRRNHHFVNRSYEQSNLEYQEEVSFQLASLILPEDRAAFIKQLRETNAVEFLNTLPDDVNPLTNDHLSHRLQEIDVPTKAFSKVKPSNNNHNKQNNSGNASVSTSSALPVCFYPHTREAILTLLGPETDSGTFPRSLLSAPLTTRLGVTVSTNVPDAFLGMTRARSQIDHASFRANVIDRGGLTNKFNSMRVKEVKQRFGLVGNNTKSSNKQRSRNILLEGDNSGSPTLESRRNNLAFLDLDQDFVPSEDDDDDYVPINPDGTINFEEYLNTTSNNNKMSTSNNTSSSTLLKKSKRNNNTMTISNLPSGADLEEFPEVLREGIRTAALEIMEKRLGPRMKFLITRQRRMAIMGQEVDFSAGGVVFVGDKNNAAKNPKLSSFAKTGVQASNRKRSAAVVPSQQIISTIARNHSLSSVHQMAADALRKGCAPLQFLMPSSSSGSASTKPGVAQPSNNHPAFDSKFPSGIHFPLPQEISTNSAINRLLTATEKQSFASNSAPYSPLTSFFAHWSGDALHNLLHQGFLQIVPANTQLCYQGMPVATNKFSDFPSIYIIMSGTVEASVQGCLPSSDAALVAASSSSGDLFSPAVVAAIASGTKNTNNNNNNNNISSSFLDGNSSAPQLHHENRKSDDELSDDDADQDDASPLIGKPKKSFLSVTNNKNRRGSSVTLPSSQNDVVNNKRRKSVNQLNEMLMNSSGTSGLLLDQAGSSQLSVFDPQHQHHQKTSANHHTVMIENFKQKKQEAWSSFFKSKGENLDETAVMNQNSTSTTASGNSNNNNNNTMITTSLASFSSNNKNNSNSSHSLNMDPKIIEDALFPLTSTKHQHFSSTVLPTTGFLTHPETAAGCGEENSRTNQNKQNHQQELKKRSTISTNVRKNIIGSVTAVGPFGLSATSSSSGTHSNPYPCSLRTQSQCEIFVIPYVAVFEALQKGNVMTTPSGDSPSTTTGAVATVSKKSSSASPVLCDAEQLLYSTACHQFGLSYFSSCCGRLLRRIPWLLRSNSSSSNASSDPMAHLENSGGENTNNNANSVLFSSELRARIASAFRPVIIDQDSLFQYRSQMALVGSTTGTKAGGGDHGHHSSSSSSSPDPLGFLILPQTNCRARVQLQEITASAESPVISVDALEPRTLFSEKIASVAQSTQVKLRSEEGIEFDSDSCFGFGLREVFVTAGRHLMSNHKNLLSSSGHNNNHKKNNHDDDDSTITFNVRQQQTDDSTSSSSSSSSTAVAHVNTAISISSAKMSREEVFMKKAEQQLAGLFDRNSSSGNLLLGRRRQSFSTSSAGGGGGGGSASALNLAASLKNLKQFANSNSARSASVGGGGGGLSPATKTLKKNPNNKKSSSPKMTCNKNGNTNTNTSSPTNTNIITDASSNNEVQGYILCFVVSASELQKRLLGYISSSAASSSSSTSNSFANSNNNNNNNTSSMNPLIENIYAKRREETKLLIQEADTKLVQYRTSAMATSSTVKEEEEQQQQKIKATKKGKSKEKKKDVNNDDDNISVVSASSSGSSFANGDEKKKKKKEVPQKTVQELLTVALERFPLIGPTCTFSSRSDILNVFSLLFEFKRYRPHSLILSQSEVAADRIIVVLKGKAILNQQQLQSSSLSIPHVSDDHSNINNNWTRLTFAGATTVLPHRWSCSAIAITEVTTAEASRALCLPFLKDTGFFDAMKVFSEAVLSFPGISSVPNLVVPDVVKYAMRCYAGQPSVHPTLNSINPTSHNVYGGLHHHQSVIDKKKNASVSSSSTVAANNHSLVPNFHSKQEQQNEEALQQISEQQHEDRLKKLKQTMTNPPLFGEERVKRDHLRFLRKQDQLEKEAEERKKAEAQKRKEDRERKAREEQMMKQLSPLEGGGDADTTTTLGAALHARSNSAASLNASTTPGTQQNQQKQQLSSQHQSPAPSSLAASPISVALTPTPGKRRDSLPPMSTTETKAKNASNNTNSKQSRTPQPFRKNNNNNNNNATFIKQHEESFQPHPTMDAESLLKSQGVILKRDFFLKDSIDPLAGEVVETNNNNETGGNTVVSAAVNHTQTRKVIANTHKSLSSGLWIKKRKPIVRPK